jgi:hypothetical protein
VRAPGVKNHKAIALRKIFPGPEKPKQHLPPNKAGGQSPGDALKKINWERSDLLRRQSERHKGISRILYGEGIDFGSVILYNFGNTLGVEIFNKIHTTPSLFHKTARLTNVALFLGENISFPGA